MSFNVDYDSWKLNGRTESWECDCCGDSYQCSTDLNGIGDEDMVCDECLNDNYTRCDCCGEYAKNDDIRDIENKEVCDECSENFVTEDLEDKLNDLISDLKRTEIDLFANQNNEEHYEKMFNEKLCEMVDVLKEFIK